MHFNRLVIAWFLTFLIFWRMKLAPYTSHQSLNFSFCFFHLPWIILVFKIEWTLWFATYKNQITMKIRILFWKYLDMAKSIRFWRVKRMKLPDHTAKYILLSWQWLGILISAGKRFWNLTAGVFSCDDNPFGTIKRATFIESACFCSSLNFTWGLCR